MPAVSMLLKPASSRCDMRCPYCFYHDAAHHRARGDLGFMSRDTARAAIFCALRAAGGGPVTFAFQGGEPTLRGADFFEDFAQDVQALNERHSPVSYALQTNGLSLDARWADFFLRHRFLIGLSLDGPADVHDAQRVDASGKGTFSRVLRASQLLKSRGVPFNTLTVLTPSSARRAQAIYSFLTRQGFSYLQFIPQLLPGGGGNAAAPETLAAALSTLCALWRRDIEAGRMVSVREFDNYASILLGRAPESCGLCGRCSFQCVVEADGSVYPCDFYCLDTFCAGNVHSHTYAQLVQSAPARAFLGRFDHLPAPCAPCEWAALCRGGCPRAHGAPPDEPHLPDPDSAYCRATRLFFDASLPDLKRAAVALAARRNVGKL